MLTFRHAVTMSLALVVLAEDNGLAVTPPMGWRNWNQYQCAISQGTAGSKLPLACQPEWEAGLAGLRGRWGGTALQ
jgi:hypothetical protein